MNVDDRFRDEVRALEDRLRRIDTAAGLQRLRRRHQRQQRVARAMIPTVLGALVALTCAVLVPNVPTWARWALGAGATLAVAGLLAAGIAIRGSIPFGPPSRRQKLRRATMPALLLVLVVIGGVLFRSVGQSLPTGTQAWVAATAVATVIVTLLVLTATTTYRVVKHGTTHQLALEHPQELARATVRAELAEGELTRIREELEELKGLLTGRTGLVVPTEIDRELQRGMDLLQAQAASVLVEAPPPNDRSHLVFLSALGPAAHRIRTVLVDKRSIAGRVIAAGHAENLRDVLADERWNDSVDLKGEFQTRTLLTVPVRLPGERGGKVLAACQFLNRADGQPFSDKDEEAAATIASRIAPHVDDFLADPRYRDVLGLPHRQDMPEASVLFCDLTASTELLQRMNTSSALLRLDEYLGSLGEIALDHGAKLVSNLGDGMMFSFNVPKPLDDHPRRALDAAWKMQADFQRIWRSWQLFGLGVLHSRIAIAIGPVLRGTIGPRSNRQETIVGSVVNLSNKLCRVAPRDRDVIVVDEETRDRVPDYLYEEITIPDHETFKVPPRMYQVVGPSERQRAAG